VISGIVLCALMLWPRAGKAQSHEVQQLLLNVEKLAQLKKILDNMYSGYEILRKGYTAIKDISQGNFSIHQVFLDKLLEVSPVVRNYKRVAEIISAQKRIVKEYKAALGWSKRSGNFSEKELHSISATYSRLFRESLEKLDELLLIITANRLRMSDDERLSAIDRIYADVSAQLSFLRKFNTSTAHLGLQREREQENSAIMRKVYGLK
jgi:hypothetical protein